MATPEAPSSEGFKYPDCLPPNSEHTRAAGCLAYPPSTNRLVRLAKGIAYKPKVVRDWTQDAAYRLMVAGATILDGPVAVGVLLHPRQTKQGSPHKRRIDLDNAIKAALDACQGVCFVDDRQVISLSAAVGEALPCGGLTVLIEPAARHPERAAQG